MASARACGGKIKSSKRKPYKDAKENFGLQSPAALNGQGVVRIYGYKLLTEKVAKRLGVN